MMSVLKFPEFATICSFIERYGERLRLPDLTIPELQRALENTAEVEPGLLELIIVLMKRVTASFKSDRWERHLVKLIQNYHSPMAAWELDTLGFSLCKLPTKLTILKYLCETQFDDNVKFKNMINQDDPNEMRIKPIGRDKLGLVYWFMKDQDFNFRLFREEQDDSDSSTWEMVSGTRDELVALIAVLKHAIGAPSLPESVDTSRSGTPLLTVNGDVKGHNESQQKENTQNNLNKEVDGAKDVGTVEDHPQDVKKENGIQDDSKVFVQKAELPPTMKEEKESNCEDEGVVNVKTETTTSLDSIRGDDSESLSKVTEHVTDGSNQVTGDTDHVTASVGNDCVTNSRVEVKTEKEMKSENSDSVPLEDDKKRDFSSQENDELISNQVDSTSDQREKVLKTSDDIRKDNKPSGVDELKKDDVSMEKCDDIKFCTTVLLKIEGKKTGGVDETTEGSVDNSRTGNSPNECGDEKPLLIDEGGEEGVDKKTNVQSNIDHEQDYLDVVSADNGADTKDSKPDNVTNDLILHESDSKVERNLNDKTLSGESADLESTSKEKDAETEDSDDDEKLSQIKIQLQNQKHSKVGLPAPSEEFPEGRWTRSRLRNKKAPPKPKPEVEEETRAMKNIKGTPSRTRSKNSRGGGRKKEVTPEPSEEEEEESTEEESEEEDGSDTEFRPHRKNEYRPTQRAPPAKKARTVGKKKGQKVEEEEEVLEESDEPCIKCGMYNHPEMMLLCDRCDAGHHTACLRPPLMYIPDDEWYCPKCEHVELLKKLEEKLQLLEIEVKKQRRKKAKQEDKFKWLLTEVCPANILPAKDDDFIIIKRKKKEPPPPQNHREDRRPRRAKQIYVEEPEEEEYIQRRSGRARKQISYKFEDFETAIHTAIKDEVEEKQKSLVGLPVSPRSSVSRGKDISTIEGALDEEAEKEERRKKLLADKRRRKRKLMDLDATDEDEDSDDYSVEKESISDEDYVGEDSEAEFEEEEEEAELFNSGSDDSISRHKGTSRSRKIGRPRRRGRSPDGPVRRSVRNLGRERIRYDHGTGSESEKSDKDRGRDAWRNNPLIKPSFRRVFTAGSGSDSDTNKSQQRKRKAGSGSESSDEGDYTQKKRKFRIESDDDSNGSDEYQEETKRKPAKRKAAKRKTKKRKSSDYESDESEAGDTRTEESDSDASYSYKKRRKGNQKHSKKSKIPRSHKKQRRKMSDEEDWTESDEDRSSTEMGRVKSKRRGSDEEWEEPHARRGGARTKTQDSDEEWEEPHARGGGKILKRERSDKEGSGTERGGVLSKTLDSDEEWEEPHAKKGEKRSKWEESEEEESDVSGRGRAKKKQERSDEEMEESVPDAADSDDSFEGSKGPSSRTTASKKKKSTQLDSEESSDDDAKPKSAENKKESEETEQTDNEEQSKARGDISKTQFNEKESKDPSEEGELVPAKELSSPDKGALVSPPNRNIPVKDVVNGESISRVSPSLTDKASAKSTGDEEDDLDGVTDIFDYLNKDNM